MVSNSLERKRLLLTGRYNMPEQELNSLCLRRIMEKKDKHVTTSQLTYIINEDQGQSE